MTTLAGLVDNVLNGPFYESFPGRTAGTTTVYEIWLHAPEGWKFMIEYSTKEMAEEHVESTNQQPFNVSRGHVFHVVESEVTVSAVRKVPTT